MSLGGLQVADQLSAGGSDRRVGGVTENLIRPLLLFEREVRKVLLLDVACIPRLRTAQQSREHTSLELARGTRLDGRSAKTHRSRCFAFRVFPRPTGWPDLARAGSNRRTKRCSR